MKTDTLQRYRDGLAAGDFTITQIAELTGIPAPRLSDMKDEAWQPVALDRVSKLEAALEKLAASEPTSARSKPRRRANA